MQQHSKGFGRAKVSRIAAILSNTQQLQNPAANVIFLFIFPLVALCALEGAARGSMHGLWQWALTNPVLFLHNYALIACPYWVLTVLRSRRVRSVLCILFTLVLYSIGMVSCYKIHYRYEPVLLSDALQLDDMRQTLRHLPLDIQWTGIWGIAALLGIGMLALLWLTRHARIKRSILWPLMGIGLFFALLPFTTLRNPFLNTQTDLVAYARQGGSLYSIIAIEKRQSALQNRHYEDEEARNAHEKIAAQTSPDAQNPPNIIFVLAESFIDQQYLSPHVQFTETLMPFYEEMLKSSASGNMYVPKIGGGTSETEFEVLTGIQSAYGHTPYSMGLPPLRSVASVLRKRGYTAGAFHWFSGVFYNRYTNLYQLGFDSFSTTDTTIRNFTRYGQYISDADHYRAALQQLRSTDGRDFALLLLMQNHGTYGYADFAKTHGADTPFTNNFSDETTLTLRHYTYLLRKSDEALREFATALHAFDEPVFVVFFSDHIPPFGAAVYEELGMDISGTSGRSVPYFIWSNTQAFSQKADLQAWQISAYALSLAGIYSDPFFSHIESLRQNGTHEDEAYRLLAYDALFGRQVAYKQEDFQPHSSQWSAGGEMRLQGFDAGEIDGKIYVLPHLTQKGLAVHLQLNGQDAAGWIVPQTQEPFTLQCVLKTPDGRILNQSEALSFASSADLLQASSPLQGLQVNLAEERFSVFHETEKELTIRSEKHYAAYFSFLTLNDETYQWKPHWYEVGAVGQYHVSRRHAPLYLVIDQEQFAGYEKTPQGIAAYLKSQNGTLMIYGQD